MNYGDLILAILLLLKGIAILIGGIILRKDGDKCGMVGIAFGTIACTCLIFGISYRLNPDFAEWVAGVGTIIFHL